MRDMMVGSSAAQRGLPAKARGGMEASTRSSARSTRPAPDSRPKRPRRSGRGDLCGPSTARARGSASTHPNPPRDLAGATAPSAGASRSARTRRARADASFTVRERALKSRARAGHALADRMRSRRGSLCRRSPARAGGTLTVRFVSVPLGTEWLRFPRRTLASPGRRSAGVAVVPHFEAAPQPAPCCSRRVPLLFSWKCRIGPPRCRPRHILTRRRPRDAQR